MLLFNVNSITDDTIKHIQIKDELIKGLAGESNVLKSSPGEVKLIFNDAQVFPGLINSHDHLEFNLFPLSGNRIYNNYKDWAKDVNEHNKESFESVLKIPQALRIEYGLYKNLLNGFTTVVNHGAFLTFINSPVTIFQDSNSLHSIQFEKNWKYKLNRLQNRREMFVIHAGEGTDKASNSEINKLIKWNIFKRKLIAIHGVAMNEIQALQFHAIVWCPASNFFLLNNTAKVDQLKKHTHIIFGTDSTLTAPWNIWEQLRLAKKTSLLSDGELLNSITSTAASVWGLNCGSITQNKTADIVVAKRTDHFYSLNPEDILMVLHKGNIRLFDESLKDQLNDQGVDLQNFTSITINGRLKYVQGNLPELARKIKQYYPGAVFPFTYQTN